FPKSDIFEAVASSIKFMTEAKFWRQVHETYPSLTFSRPSGGKTRQLMVTFADLETVRENFREAYDDEKWVFDDPTEMDSDSDGAEYLGTESTHSFFPPSLCYVRVRHGTSGGQLATFLNGLALANALVAASGWSG